MTAVTLTGSYLTAATTAVNTALSASFGTVAEHLGLFILFGFAAFALGIAGYIKWKAAHLGSGRILAKKYNSGKNVDIDNIPLSNIDSKESSRVRGLGLDK